MRRHCPSHLHCGSCPPAPLPTRRLTAAPPRATLGQEVVLIPVKGFRHAKRRLGGSMTDEMREHLVRSMAESVVAACAPLPVAVVCDDPEVATWAEALGATVMWEPGQGLNGAVRAGVEQLAAPGVQWVIVAHGDLPRARDLGHLAPFDGITLVPDRKDDGTNVLRLPVSCDFRFAYGPGLLSVTPRRGDTARAACPRSAHTGPGLRRGLAGRCGRADEVTRRRHPPPASFRQRSARPRTSLGRSGRTGRRVGHRRAPRRHRVRVRRDAGQVGGRAGRRIHHLVLTDGAKGTWDPQRDAAALAAQRQEEQRRAAALLGGGDVVFLGRTDGELRNGVAEQRDVSLVDPAPPSRCHSRA